MSTETWYRLDRHKLTIERVPNIVAHNRINVIISDSGFYGRREYSEKIITDHSLLFPDFVWARRVAIETLKLRIVTAKQSIADMETLIIGYTVTGLGANGDYND